MLQTKESDKRHGSAARVLGQDLLLVGRQVLRVQVFQDKGTVFSLAEWHGSK